MKMFFPTHTALCYKMAGFTIRRLCFFQVLTVNTSRLHSDFVSSFGRARDADVTLILFIRPHFVTFIRPQWKGLDPFI